MVKYGQHFMVDKEVLAKIAKLVKGKCIEIGGGHGELTKLIKPWKVFEIDEKLAKENNFINRNALKENLDCDFIVGNISYEIAEPLIGKLVKTKFKEAILCVPKKFASNLKEHVIFSKLFKIELLFEVGKDAFDPKPSVNSYVIRIKPKRLIKKNQVIKELFLQGDKKVKNAFREANCRVYKKNKREVDIPKLDFLDKKIYQLDSAEWKKLASVV